jgi:hypothetical protein
LTRSQRQVWSEGKSRAPHVSGTCPWSTLESRYLERCAYTLVIPSPWSRTTVLPYPPPYHPAKVTTPALAAFTSVPWAAAMSIRKFPRHNLTSAPPSAIRGLMLGQGGEVRLANIMVCELVPNALDGVRGIIAL